MSFIFVFVLGLVSMVIIAPITMWVMRIKPKRMPKGLMLLLTAVASVVAVVDCATDLARGQGYESLTWIGWPLGVFAGAFLLRRFYERRLRVSSRG